MVWLSAVKNKKLSKNLSGTFTLVGDMPSAIVRVDLSGIDFEGSLDQFAHCKAITSFNVSGCKQLKGNCFHTA